MSDQKQADARRNRQYYGCLLAVATGSLALLVARILLLPAPPHGYSCARSMQQIGVSLQMYSSGQGPQAADGQFGDGDKIHFYPTISPGPGKLMFRTELMYPTYLPDARTVLCPNDSEFRPFGIAISPYGVVRKPPIDEEAARKMIDDWSYFYLGYGVRNDEDVELFARAYREGKSMDDDIVYPDPLVPGGKRTLFRLCEGIERKLLPPGSEPGAEVRLASEIPVLIERIGNHKHEVDNRDGAHVLYLLGHVKFIKYPGEWPMTPKTVRLLRELDDLGKSGK